MLRLDWRVVIWRVVVGLIGLQVCHCVLKEDVCVYM